MNVKTIKLKNFRSHYQLNLEFNKGINVLEGRNACGKTNIAEALYYLSLARSFRKVDDSQLISYNHEIAEIESLINEGDVKRKIKIIIDKNGKYIFLNGNKIKRISELSNVVNAIVFEPKDVLLFKGSPKERRNFLDLSISKISNIYLEYLNEYEKILKERNEALKDKNFDKNLLEILTDKLINISEKIITYRMSFSKDINDILNKLAHALTGVRTHVVMNYQPFVTYNSSFKIEAKKYYEKYLENDLKNKSTSIGIHREDFYVKYNDKNIAEYGSQGENRMVALALKLSPYFLQKDKNKRPFIILDDVMSELDQTHQIRLIKLLKKFEQVFITTTKLQIDGVNHYQIK